MLLSFRLEESREEDREIIRQLNQMENRSDWIRKALLKAARAEKETADILDQIMAAFKSGETHARRYPADDQDQKMTVEELAAWIHSTGGRSDGNLDVDLQGYNDEEKTRVITLLKGMEAVDDVCKND